ncbi:MAG: O-antigen ligase family protein [Hyphomonadaceae bacterium]
MSTVSSGAAGPPPAEQAAGFRHQRLNSLLNYTRYTDPAVLVVWVFVTTFDLNFITPLRYAAAGYFAAMALLLGRQTAPVIVRSWPLFIIPLLCTLSSLWALDPGDAVRKGIALAMTGLIAIYISTRMSGRQILVAYFSVEILVALISTAVGAKDPGGAWIGIYTQKNFFAIQMFILYATSIGIMLDRGQIPWLRMLALLMSGFAAFLILMAKSSTTTLLIAIMTVMILGQAFFWGPAGKIRHARSFFGFIIVIIGLIVSLFLFGILQIDLKEQVQVALGKDSTMSGRTYLWEIARRLIDEHPWTGLGANSFWRAELGPANSIAQYFLYDKFQGFSFHNSYYENGVSFGYPGFYATIFVAGWAVFNSARTWLRNQTVLNAIFFMIAAAVVIRTNSEADLAGEFGGTVVLLFVAATRREIFGKPATQKGLPGSTHPSSPRTVSA